MRNMKFLFVTLIAVVSALSFVSCNTEAGICYGPEHPHRTDLVVKMTWDDADEDKPDTMVVLAHRVFNSWKCGLLVNAEAETNGGVVTGRYFFNAPPAPVVPEVSDTLPEVDGDSVPSVNGGVVDGGDVNLVKPISRAGLEVEPVKDLLGTYANPFRVLDGTYKFFTFNLDSTLVSYENINEFLEETSEEATAFEDVNAVYKTYALNNDTLIKVASSWRDYNPYPAGKSNRYIQSEIPALYYDVLTKKEIRAGATNVCELEPQRLTQRIVIEFKINKTGEDVAFKVDSVVAEIAGVPHKINLATGNLDISETYKMMFRMQVLGADGMPLATAQDSLDATTLVCRDTIDVTGLVVPQSSDLTSGPGIMCVRVFTSVEQDGQTVVNDLPCKINLYNTITRAALLNYDADGITARKRRNQATLRVSTPLLLDGTKIEEATVGSSADAWLAL